MKKCIPFAFFLLYMISITVSACAATGVQIPCEASSDHGRWEICTKNGVQALHNSETGKTIYRVYRATENGLVELDLEEYAHSLNVAIRQQTPQKMEPSISIPDSEEEQTSIAFYRYDETSVRTIQGTPVAVTPDSEGPCDITRGESVTISHSFGGNVSLNAEMKNKIKGGVSFTWNQSASTTVSYSVSFPVPAGQTCHVEFTPDLNRTTGILYRASSNPSTGSVTDYVSLGRVWGDSPKKLSNGFASGVYRLVER